MIAAAATGFATGLSLILAIGAQNAFVLRQGLLKSHVFAVAMTCAIADAVLIAAGVAGFGALTDIFPALPDYLMLAGALFLMIYGLIRLRAAWQGGQHLQESGKAQALWPTILTSLAFSWLNPHVWLDTIGLIGAVSTGFEVGMARMAFAIGAMTASFAFFFSLAYGARLLAPLMRGETAWRVLDLAIGLTMWAIAASLVLAVLA